MQLRMVVVLTSAWILQPPTHVHVAKDSHSMKTKGVAVVSTKINPHQMLPYTILPYRHYEPLRLASYVTF